MTINLNGRDYPVAFTFGVYRKLTEEGVLTDDGALDMSRVHRVLFWTVHFGQKVTGQKPLTSDEFESIVDVAPAADVLKAVEQVAEMIAEAMNVQVGNEQPEGQGVKKK